MANTTRVVLKKFVYVFRFVMPVYCCIVYVK